MMPKIPIRTTTNQPYQQQPNRIESAWICGIESAWICVETEGIWLAFRFDGVLSPRMTVNWFGRLHQQVRHDVHHGDVHYVGRHGHRRVGQDGSLYGWEDGTVVAGSHAISEIAEQLRHDSREYDTPSQNRTECEIAKSGTHFLRITVFVC